MEAEPVDYAKLQRELASQRRASECSDCEYLPYDVAHKKAQADGVSIAAFMNAGYQHSQGCAALVKWCKNCRADNQWPARPWIADIKHEAFKAFVAAQPGAFALDDLKTLPRNPCGGFEFL